jgi:hypothetical protein
MIISVPDRRQPYSELSAAAELFLIAIDPNTGRLVKRRRRRFRKALRASKPATPAGSLLPGRAAVRELKAHGFVESSFLPGHFPVVPGSGYGASLARLRRGMVSGSFGDVRDLRLFALLAWTGVLAQRLDRSDRKAAARRIRKLMTPPEAQYTELEAIPPIARALGQVAFREEVDILQDIVGDFLSGDSIGVDLGGGFDTGGMDSGGSDSGGGDSGN